MLKRLLSGLALWTLIVVGCFALSETSVPASQDITPQPAGVPETPSVTRQTRLDPSVDQQMVALGYHARVNMILYTGPFGQGEWASTRNPLDAIALTLKAGSK